MLMPKYTNHSHSSLHIKYQDTSWTMHATTPQKLLRNSHLVCVKELKVSTLHQNASDQYLIELCGTYLYDLWSAVEGVFEGVFVALIIDIH